MNETKSYYEQKLRRIQRRLIWEIIKIGKEEKDDQRMAAMVEGVCLAMSIIEEEQEPN